MTAAHCTSNGVERVVVGLHALDTSDTDECVQVCSVADIMDHPSYDPTTLNNDISIIRLSCNIQYDPVYRIDDTSATITVQGTMLTVAGW